MKSLVLKSLVIPILYIGIMTILWGDHSRATGVFFPLMIIAHLYLTDVEKGVWKNFLEINGLITLLFGITSILPDSDKVLALQYIGIIAFSFFAVYYLKSRRKSISL